MARGRGLTSGLRAVFLPRWPDNPYQDLLAGGLASLGVRVDALPRSTMFLGPVARRRPDVVHVHAPDHFVVYSRTPATAVARLAAFTVQLGALRAAGTHVVWTAHDLVNHERRHPRVDRACRILTARLATAIIVHCTAARRAVAARCRLRCDDNVFVIPHGHYLGAYPPTTLDGVTAREALGLPRDETVLLFLGNLRDHKGLDSLLDAFATLDRPSARLVIAGQPFTSDIAGRLAARSRHMVRVDVRPGYVPADRVAVYMRAADAVVCPFTSSLTSGSLALAMSFGRACIAPRLGCIPEALAADGGIMYEPGGTDALAEALRAAVDRKAELGAMGRRNREAMERRDWGTIARSTLDVYRWCITPGGPRPGMAARTP